MEVFTARDGCRIAYRIDGPTSGRPLLLANSLGTTMDMWAAQTAVLANTFKVVRYDARGHGQSGVPAGSYSLDRLGCDALELLDSLDIGQASFCGVSMGGMIGQWLGVRAPDRLDRLILANTSPFMGPMSGWDARIASVLKDGMGSIVASVVERWFTPDFRKTEESRVVPLRDMLLRTDAAGYTGCCAAIRDMDMRRVLGTISTPTLIIGGSEDPATPPEHSHHLADGIAGARLIMLPAAHLSNVEQPSRFTDAMLDFIQ